MEKSLPEKMTMTELVKISWANCNHSTTSHPISWRL